MTHYVVELPDGSKVEVLSDGTFAYSTKMLSVDEIVAVNWKLAEMGIPERLKAQWH